MAISSYTLQCVLQQDQYSFRFIIDFQQKLTTWRNDQKSKLMEVEKAPLAIVPCEHSVAAATVKLAKTSTKPTDRPSSQVPSLKKILKLCNPKLLEYVDLGSSNRKTLSDTIVDYFFKNHIPFTQDVRTEMARQVKDLFINEDEVSRKSLFDPRELSAQKFSF